jgi:hypothetical protein
VDVSETHTVAAANSELSRTEMGAVVESNQEGSTISHVT